jgi:hypothetical protein
MDRIGRCALPKSAAVYADISRTGRQRYCSTRCGIATPYADTEPDTRPRPANRFRVRIRVIL